MQDHPQTSWPLVSFEHYMLADDRASWPMTYPAIYEFCGQIDLQALRSALRVALDRHPFLDSRIERTATGLEWKRSSDADLAATEDAGGGPMDRRLDPFTERPFRWRWVAGNDQISGSTGGAPGKLMLVFHHAAVDGIGGLMFVGDWLAAYDQLVCPQRGTRLRSVDVDSLLTRGRAAVAKDNQAQKRGLGIGGIAREISRFFFRRVTPLASPPAVSAEPVDLLYSVTLSVAESDALRRVADRLGVTLNDVAMCDLLRNLRGWNQRYGASGRWYRITMPVNLRDRAQLKMPAANRIGYAIIDRDMNRWVDDPDGLLQSLAAEHAVIRGDGLAASFLAVLSGAGRIPGGMRLLTRQRGCVTTAVFSNVGDPTRRFISKLPSIDGQLVAGDLKLAGISGGPPTRSGTPAAFLLTQYRGQIRLVVTVSPECLGREQAEQLVGGWRAMLLTTLERHSA